MKIKFGKVLIEVPDEKSFEALFSKPNPEFYKDLFNLSYSSFTNYLEECAKCAEKYVNTGESNKSEDE